jgi:hypothetical protein
LTVVESRTNCTIVQKSRVELMEYSHAQNRNTF